MNRYERGSEYWCDIACEAKARPLRQKKTDWRSISDSDIICVSTEPPALRINNLVWNESNLWIDSNLVIKLILPMQYVHNK